MTPIYTQFGVVVGAALRSVSSGKLPTALRGLSRVKLPAPRLELFSLGNQLVHCLKSSLVGALQISA
jgi:hypothetical protein